jgi:hypothetical protein
MAGRPIVTSHATVICDVCGRSLLRGEQCEVFIGGGERRSVCELCTARATNEGWVREGAGADLALPSRGGERTRSLLGRLRQRREADSSADDAAPANGSRRRPSAPAPPPREPRRVHAVPADTELQSARALELFNASDHPRTVAGIGRSLGSPLVSVVPMPDGRGRVSILIAWELCWYRYEADLAREVEAVAIAEQGDDLVELGAPAPQPNATADEHGELRLASAPT